MARHDISRRLVVCLGLAALPACTTMPTQPQWLVPPECIVVPPPGDAPETITVALLEPVEPSYAPWARNRSERILFGHLFETLVSVDCTGQIRPGLADAWERHDRGRRWVFTLRRGAMFSDRSPVTTLDVVTAWQDAMTLETGVDSARAIDDDRVEVFLARPHRDVPVVLSAPEFAVGKWAPREDALIGSGRYALAAAGRLGGTNLVAQPADKRQRADLRFLRATATDARDLLERGVDVIVTSAPEVIAYAADNSAITTVALEWDRIHVLVSSARVLAIRRGESVGHVDREFLDALARDAVRGDARACEGRPWWERSSGCGRERIATDPAWRPEAMAKRRIVYDRSDAAAREIAERIVALAGAGAARDTGGDTGARGGGATAITEIMPDLLGGPGRLAAAGLDEASLASSLERGADYAYVVAVPRRAHDDCFESQRLLKRAPWLAGDGSDVLEDAVVPLVETRAHLIVRSGHAGVTTDWFGNIHVSSRAAGGW